MTTVENEFKKEQVLLNKTVLIVGPESELKQKAIERMEEEGAKVAVLTDPSEDFPSAIDIIINLTLNSQQTKELFQAAEPLLNEKASIVNLVFKPEELERYDTEKARALGEESASIISLSGSFAEKFGRVGKIRVVPLLMGPVDTESFYEIVPEGMDKEAISETRALGWIPTVDQIMNAVVFAASDQASYITRHRFSISDSPIG